MTNPLAQEVRDRLKTDPNAVEDYYSLKCHMGVWDEGAGTPAADRAVRLNEISRANQCFHYPYQQGMMFKAAQELQHREQENRQLKRSNLYTRVGLWIAALGLVASAMATLVAG